MVKAGDTLFVAGPPDRIDKNDPLGPFVGRGKALLRSFSAKEGKAQAEVALAAQPVFDGMIAANGNLYIAHTSGALNCWRWRSRYALRYAIDRQRNGRKAVLTRLGRRFGQVTALVAKRNTATVWPPEPPLYVSPRQLSSFAAWHGIWHGIRGTAWSSL